MTTQTPTALCLAVTQPLNILTPCIAYVLVQHVMLLISAERLLDAHMFQELITQLAQHNTAYLGDLGVKVRHLEVLHLKRMSY